MPTVTYRSQAPWRNYHCTLGAFAPGSPWPEMTIDSLATIDASDTSQLSGLERFAATGAALFDHLASLAPPEPPGDLVAAGIVGQGWSFAPLIGTPFSQLLCPGLSGITELAAQDCSSDSSAQADFVALASGGTTLADLAVWAEERGRSIRTSGTYLFSTIAGSAATASHGSRLGYGGTQNMILGMHLIVGSEEHVWIERKSSPVISATGLARLAIRGKAPRLVQDDERFEDALVHLGAMGIVNGVAVELHAEERFSLMQRVEPLTLSFLDAIATGSFDAVARRLNCAAAPAFYELTLNPHAPFDDAATHILYFPTSRAALLPAGDARIVWPGDAISQLGLQLFPQAMPPNATVNFSAVAQPRSVPPWVLPLLLKGADSVFAYYRGLKTFDTIANAFDPDDPSLPPPYRWSELHHGEITGGIPGALYNASFAVPLDRVAKAIPVICAAVRDLPGSFVFTLRFVTCAAGTLAFTRFENTAVIEIDGLSPLICQLAKANVDMSKPNAAELLRALDELTLTLPAGAAAVRKGLEADGIPYSMHWAKLGDLDRAKVYADYGHPLDPEALTYRWRDTRDFLLDSLGKRHFWSDALIAYGLVEPG